MCCDKSRKLSTRIGTKLFLCSIVLAVVATVAGAAEPIQSFKFEEQFSIRKALAMLGSAYQKNIVPTPGVDGSLAFRGLSDVTFEEAMDAILGEKFKYEHVGKLVKVYTKEEYKTLKEDPDRMVYDILTLYYITAADAQNLLTAVLSANAKIQVTSPAEQEISSGSSGSGGAMTATAEGGGGDSMALHDTIVIFDYPENIQAAKDLLSMVDVRPKQVLVEAMILAARLTEEMSLGVDWNFAAGGHLIAGAGGVPDAINTVDGLPGAPIETLGFASQGGPGLKIGATAGDFRMLITALESVTDTTILANPKVLTVNKQEGSVLIGTNLGYRSSTTISTGGVATQGEVEFLQTGTQLIFRPYIGNDGYIRMDIYPKDSSAELNDDGVPTEQTVQMKSNIVVKDGGTILIGGLFRDTIVAAKQQVPILGDLPIVGGLFRGTTDRSQREEVIIFLTTHIIDEPDGAMGLEAAQDTRLKEMGAKKGLEVNMRTRLAEDAYAKGAQFYIEGDLESALVEVNYALRIRPTYLEALKLKEKITVEMTPTEEEESTGMVIESSDAL